MLKINSKGLKKLILLLALVLSVALVTGCEEWDEMEASDHTLNLGGAWHKPGHFDPMANCTSCHGASLQGSGEAPSCFSCHGTKW